MFRLLTRTKPTASSSQTYLFRAQQHIRHASTKSKKKASKKPKAAPKSTPISEAAKPGDSSTSLPNTFSPSTSSPHTSWRIEPQLSYMESKLRQPKSAGMIIATVGLALGSIVGTSLAFPNPEDKERLELELRQAEEAALGATRRGDSAAAEESEPEAKDQRPRKSVLGFILMPINFIFRPIYATPDERAVAQQTWQFWAGMTSGLCAFGLFVVSHFASPRYIRMLTITPPTPAVPSGSLWLTPFSGRAVSYPLAQSTLLSPLFSEGDRMVMKTAVIKGPRGAYLGWGLTMLQGNKGAVLVNGQDMQPQQAVVLLENLWVSRGGKIDVA